MFCGICPVYALENNLPNPELGNDCPDSPGQVVGRRSDLGFLFPKIGDGGH